MLWGVRGRARRHRGQSMVEFALVSGVFFFALMSSVDGGLLMFTVGAGNHSAEVGEITLADEGNFTGASTNADCDAIANLMASGFGLSSLAVVDEIDIYQLDFPSGQPTPDATNYNVYTPAYFSGSACFNYATTHPAQCPWPPSQRSVIDNGQLPDQNPAGTLTNVGLTIKYHYSYLAIRRPSLNLTETRYFRLEPQANS